MPRTFNLPLTVFALCLAGTSHLHAAIQVEGVTTYEGFSNVDGKPGVPVRESFHARVDGNKWLITTRLLTPDSRTTTSFPSNQEVGSDGENIYFCKAFDLGSNIAHLVWILPESQPRLGESPALSLLWLAYCAGTVLTNEAQAKLQSFWTDSGTLKGENRTECLLPVKFKRGNLASGCLESVEFLSDGRVDMCDPSRDLTNLWFAPLDGGYTRAAYRVGQTTAIPDGPRLPAAFVLESFSPEYGMETNGPVFKKLKTTMKLSAIVTNTSLVVAPTNWLPQLPNEGVVVQDYRPKIFYGGSEPKNYWTTNHWPELPHYQKLKEY